ncbi:MAG: hypothetical protein V4604_12575 [Bacteroidota bacterium]
MKIVTSIICTLFVLTSYAQYDGKDPKIASRFRPGFMWFNTGWRPAKEGRPRKYDRLMIDLTYNDWVNDSSLFLVKPSSIGYNLNCMWDIPLVDGNTVALGIGLSYRYQRVGYNGVMFRDSVNRSTEWMLYKDDQQGPDKSIFGSHAFAVPLELRFRFEKWKHFKVHLGGFIGYRVQTFTKAWYNNKETIIKDRSFYDDDPLFYGVHARIGIRNWAFFASYTLTEQFKSDKSTSLKPISFGITLSIF